MIEQLRTEHPRVSVVVITKDRRDELLSGLSRLQTLPERPEIIVVDNGSLDDTSDAVRRHFPDVKLISLDENLGAAGRNVGVRAARAPYVAFADDDSGWEPGALDRAADVLDQHTGVGLVAARLVVGEERRDDPVNELLKDSPLEREPGLPGPPILGFLACAAVVRKEAFLEAGGFEARFIVGGEEELLALDMSSFGWKLVYVDDVIACHLPSLVRDSRERRRREVRNALWTTWLRRRGAGVATGTRAALRHALTDASGVGGALQALGGLPWVIRKRRRLPPRVESERRRLERTPPPPGASSRTTDTSQRRR